MTIKQVNEGKEWVTDAMRTFANEYNVQICNLKWGRGEKGFDRGMWSLAYFIGNKRYVEQFSEESLNNCMGSENVRNLLERHLRKLIKSKSTARK